MPTYEYECGNCGKHFDYFQSMSDAPKQTCEECGGQLTKLLSAGSGLIFKGSGFYITDYKSKSGGETKSEGGSESKGASDAKPAGEAKKPETKSADTGTSTGGIGTSSSSKTD